MNENKDSLFLRIVGDNVRRLRGKMSQSELAKKAGVSRSTVQKAEKGISIEFDHILQIARALKVHPTDLFLTDDDRKEITYKTKLIMDRLKIGP